MAPNPIDFNKVFNANLAENPIALAAVLGIFGVYLVLAVYARREDKKDVEKVLTFLIMFCCKAPTKPYTFKKSIVLDESAKRTL